MYAHCKGFHQSILCSASPYLNGFVPIKKQNTASPNRRKEENIDDGSAVFSRCCKINLLGGVRLLTFICPPARADSQKKKKKSVSSSCLMHEAVGVFKPQLLYLTLTLSRKGNPPKQIMYLVFLDIFSC